MKARIRDFIRKSIEKLGYQIQPVYHGQPNPIRLWDGDKYFNNLMREVADYTVVDRVRCFMIYQLIKHANNLPGDVAEVGVYKGGTAKLLANLIEQSKNLYLFDTFAGIPSSDLCLDYHKTGDFERTSLERVKRYLGDCKGIHFYQGIFPDTATPIKDKVFCLVHIDVDIYKSVLDCCDFFYPRMVKGGIMIFDDYGFLTCSGAKKAVDEFFLGKAEKICYLPTGQGIVIRL